MVLKATALICIACLPSAKVNADYTVTLSTFTAGTQPLTVTWYRASDNAALGNGLTLTVGPISATTSYYAKGTNSCGSATGQSLTAYIPLPTPAGLTATKTGSTQITVSWSPVAGATSYHLQRISGSGWSDLPNVTTTSWNDTGLSANTTYAYRVCAQGNNGTNDQSAYSNVDLATTMTFTPVTRGTFVAATQFDELLQAVNAVRAASGWTAVTWSNILAEDQPLPAPNVIVMASHLLALRGRMSEALEALGVPAPGYTDPDPSLHTITANDITELQMRAQ